MVLQPFKQLDEDLMADADLAGPLVFCLCLGSTLLLSGKVHFGAIYGYGGSSCVSVYILLNLLAPQASGRAAVAVAAALLPRASRSVPDHLDRR